MYLRNEVFISYGLVHIGGEGDWDFNLELDICQSSQLAKWKFIWYADPRLLKIRDMVKVVTQSV